jgi:hypothetical protein
MGTYRRFSSHKTEEDVVQWDYGSWPDGLPKKDGANALSGAGSLDTATTPLSKTSRTKNLIIERVAIFSEMTAAGKPTLSVPMYCPASVYSGETVS